MWPAPVVFGMPLPKSAGTYLLSSRFLRINAIQNERIHIMELTGKPNGGAGPANIRNNIEKAAATASTAAHQAVDKMAEAARPAVDRIASNAHQTVDRLAGAATAAAGTIEQKTVQINAASTEMIDGCRSYVQAHPLKSIGIAAAAGFILSRLFNFR
jgi:ElaB/YqjD/DUF883 family membrane-anchored ribosome-binding protein